MKARNALQETGAGMYARRGWSPILDLKWSRRKSIQHYCYF